MIVQIFIALFIISGLAAFWSLREINSSKPKAKILRREKKGLFGVIDLRR